MLVFDLAEIGLDRDRPPAVFEGDDWACQIRFEYDDQRHRLMRHIVTFRRHHRRHHRRHRRRQGQHAAARRSSLGSSPGQNRRASPVSPIGDGWHRHAETHVIQLFDTGQVARLLRRLGFRVRVVRRYGEYRLLHGRAGLLARKAE
jgi:hypothetical protein